MVTEEQKEVLKRITPSEFSYNSIIPSSPQRINCIIGRYYQQKPVIEDLVKSNINITHDLNDLNYPEYYEAMYRKAVPILVKWLNKKDLSNAVKAIIIKILLARKLSKEQAFDTIIEVYQTPGAEQLDEWGFR